MNKQLAFNYLKLRIIVGSLGEHTTHRWWATSFLNETGGSFLSHVFTKTFRAAQYQGIKEAACKVHDEFIGVGKVYHLFRLPEEIEYNLNNLLLNESETLNSSFTQAQDSERALEELSQLSGGNKVKVTGPIMVGNTNLLSKPSNIQNLAQYYWGAFVENNKVYPYFSE